MTDRPAGDISALLEQRAQFEQWLTRLGDAGSGAPESVRSRVRTDYEGRLQRIMDELKQHASTVEREITRHRTALADLEQREARSRDALSEAEVRHGVGEYDDHRWEEIRRVEQGTLDGTQKELEAVRGEIARLAEVQALITKPAPAAPTPPAPRPPVEAVPPAPAARKPESARLPGDELDFLKSVTDEGVTPTPAERQRASGPQSVAAAPAPAPAPVPLSAPAAARPAAGPKAAAATSPSGQTKTLKCGECGTLNRPTEWYCERCGAELAAL